MSFEVDEMNENILRETLEKNKEEYIKYLSDLIAIDTQVIGHGIGGGLEKKGQEYMKELFQFMGADEINEDPMKEEVIEDSLEKHHEGNRGHNYEGRFNLYGHFKGKSRKNLMFNGHIDTMPPGELSQWNTEPHTPVILDNKLYGLGSADMKSGLMAATLAVKLIKDAGMELPVEVIISSVCDEEGGGNGSILAAMNGLKADGVVVCEPTNDELILAHMGFVFFKVDIKGKANHSGGKWLGVSAIDKAIKIINELNEVEHRWLLTYKHPLLPAPNLNVGVINGGTAGSTVPGECSFSTCIHYLPQVMTMEQVISEFEGAVNRIADSDLWLKEHRPSITMYQSGGAFEMEENHDFVNTFKKSYEAVNNKAVKVVGSPAGCDSRIWKNVAGCPTIQFGPGALEQCHSVNEYVSIEQYLNAILIYAQMIMNWNQQ
ncbi:MAG: M20 family metallopeptidase [Clostridium sp.]|nr:M20 family metallopeptidase [Clostridium sp.]MDU7083893.1 M20 family metallopeptidase [Clostridium sp.]